MLRFSQNGKMLKMCYMNRIHFRAWERAYSSFLLYFQIFFDHHTFGEFDADVYDIKTYKLQNIVSTTA